MDKFCEDCIHNEVCQYGAIPPHEDRCNDKDTIDDIRLHGKWIIQSTGEGTNYFVCSNCHKAGDGWDSFCRRCGAQMDVNEAKN